MSGRTTRAEGIDSGPSPVSASQSGTAAPERRLTLPQRGPMQRRARCGSSVSNRLANPAWLISSNYFAPIASTCLLLSAQEQLRQTAAFRLKVWKHVRCQQHRSSSDTRAGRLPTWKCGRTPEFSFEYTDGWRLQGHPADCGPPRSPWRRRRKSWTPPIPRTIPNLCAYTRWCQSSTPSSRHS